MAAPSSPPRKIASWLLETWMAIVGETVAINDDAGVVHRVVLSKDCSQIFFVASNPETQDSSCKPFVRDVRTGNTLAESTVEFDMLVEKHEDATQGAESCSYGNWVWEVGKEGRPERLDE